MRAPLVMLAVLTLGSVQAQDPLLLTTLPRIEAERIRDHLAQQGLTIAVEVLSEDLKARLARGPQPAVLHAIDGFALIDLLDAGRLHSLPRTLSDRLEPVWTDRGGHVLVTMAEPWVLAYDQGAWRGGAPPTDFDAFIDPNFAGELTLAVPRSSPSLWMAWIQDQRRQYSLERAFAWLGSIDARVLSYQDSTEDCLRAMTAGHADISVLPLGEVLAISGRGGSLDYNLPEGGIPLRGLGLAALVEVDAEIERLLSYLLDPELALHLARQHHILPSLREGLSSEDLPPLLRPILGRAIPYRPRMGDRQAWFSRWEQRVRGRGRSAEQLYDWLDLLFGGAFLVLLVVIFLRTRPDKS